MTYLQKKVVKFFWLFVYQLPVISDEDLHKIMDINKVFPKPREVEEELKKKKEEEERLAEKLELDRIKSLAPPIQQPKMSQLIEEIFCHFIEKKKKIRGNVQSLLSKPLM